MTFDQKYFESLRRTPEEWHERIQEEHDLILRLMPPSAGERILDVGCGKGRIEVLLTNAEPSIEMVSSDVTDEARKYIKGEFTKCSMEKMPFPDSSFDKIFCLHVIAHFRDGRKGIQEAFRVLKPGGKLMVLTPNKYFVFFSKFATFIRGKRFVYDQTARWLYSRGSLDKTLRACPWMSIEHSYLQAAPRMLPFERLRAKVIAVAIKCTWIVSSTIEWLESAVVFEFVEISTIVV
jgi:ubiquinone/menaquinone biosynthesis C-methylase UbiE